MKISIHKIITLISAIILACNVYGQITSSPYTLFGVGQVENNGFGLTKAMGGTGIAFQSSNYLNNTNPASYSGINEHSFLFEAGVFFKGIKYSTHSSSDDDETERNQYDADIRYIAMGFRINKYWSVSFGVVPYTSIGYSIQTYEDIEDINLEYYKTYSGSGGINQFYFSNSILLAKGLSAGVNFSYFLGKIEQTESAIYSDGDMEYDVTYTSRMHRAYVDFGLQYTLKLGQWNYSVGLIYGNNKRLFSTDEAIVASSTSTDTIEVDEDYEQVYHIPKKYGIGIAINKGKKIKIGLDYEKKFWSTEEFTNPYLITRDSERFSAGVDFTPLRTYSDHGLMRFYYRLGINYTKSHLLIDDIGINSKSAVIGIGVPLPRNLCMINVAFEYGINGTTSHGLVRENYWMIHLNLGLHDLWFKKVKYD